MSIIRFSAASVLDLLIGGFAWGLPGGRVKLVQDNVVRVQPAVVFRSLSYGSVLTGGIEGIDTRDLSLGDYYTPLPIDDKSRLLEGLNAAGERQ